MISPLLIRKLSLYNYLAFDKLLDSTMRAYCQCNPISTDTGYPMHIHTRTGTPMLPSLNHLHYTCTQPRTQGLNIPLPCRWVKGKAERLGLAFRLEFVPHPGNFTHATALAVIIYIMMRMCTFMTAVHTFGLPFQPVSNHSSLLSLTNQMCPSLPRKHF